MNCELLLYSFRDNYNFAFVTCGNLAEVKKEKKMGDKVIPVKVAVRVRPLVPKEVRKDQ